MKPQTKTDTAIELLEKGEIRKALAILKTFKLDTSKEEKRVLELAHEMRNNMAFYTQLGINYQVTCMEACQIINRKYLDNGKRIVLIFELNEFKITKGDFWLKAEKFLISRNIPVPPDYNDCIKLAYSHENQKA